MKISASLYAADPLRLSDEIDAVSPHVDSLHIDIMDGRFAPEFGLYERLVRDIMHRSALPIDVHLMVQEPMRPAARFSELGARLVAFHVEGDHSINDVAAVVRSHGSLAYASLRHTTDTSTITHMIDAIDGLLFLTAPAGGGCFDDHAFDRLARRPQGLPVIVDGKIDSRHFSRLIELEVDLAVIGGALFSKGTPDVTAREFTQSISSKS
jgi:ribulose-phosphate 3-epimerase